MCFPIWQRGRGRCFNQMSLRHSSAVKTLKGKSGFLLRKCLFSVMSASAPTHSVYAAMKASASLKPFLSYLVPNSKGTRKSSSIIDNFEMKSKNSRNSLWSRLCLTSSTMVRGIRSWYSAGELPNKLITDLHESFTGGVKANTYMFVSSTRSKFFFPEFFPSLTQLFNYLFFSHAFKGRFPLRHKSAKFFKMLHSTFGIRFLSFHCLSPLFKDYYLAYEMSSRAGEMILSPLYQEGCRGVFFFLAKRGAGRFCK